MRACWLFMCMYFTVITCMVIGTVYALVHVCRLCACTPCTFFIYIWMCLCAFIIFSLAFMPIPDSLRSALSLLTPTVGPWEDEANHSALWLSITPSCVCASPPNWSLICGRCWGDGGRTRDREAQLNLDLWHTVQWERKVERWRWEKTDTWREWERFRDRNHQQKSV